MARIPATKKWNPDKDTPKSILEPTDYGTYKKKLSGPVMTGKWNWVTKDDIRWDFSKNSRKLAKAKDMITGGYIEIGYSPVYANNKEQLLFYSDGTIYQEEIKDEEGNTIGYESDMFFQEQDPLYSYNYKDPEHVYIPDRDRLFATRVGGRFVYEASVGFGDGYSTFSLLEGQSIRLLAEGNL